MTVLQDQISLHDIAFEGRNKDYGAYFLSKTANRRLGISLAFSVVLFLILTSLFYLGMEWVRNHQPVYLMPSVSVGLENTLPSIFSSGIESIPDSKNSSTSKVTAKSSPEFEQITEIVPEEINKPTASDGESNTQESNAGNKAGSSAGIPWGSGEVFLEADVIPQFEGGREALSKYLSKNVRYPEQAIDKRLQGTVLVCFVVTSDGLVKDVKIVKGIESSLDTEALRVVSSMPPWKPGLRAGKPVNIVLTLPIRFDLKLHFSS
jgi:protein TonB